MLVDVQENVTDITEANEVKFQMECLFMQILLEYGRIISWLLNNQISGTEEQILMEQGTPFTEP